MRGRGNKGVVDHGRPFLCELDLSDFGTSDSEQFEAALDQATEGLKRSFPSGARHWGLARKGLNIFLRECLYTVYLRDRYNLGAAEAFFEIPLDSLTGTALRRADSRLPRWRTVQGLQPTDSEAFQTAARRLGRKRGIARVHLDALWWGERTSAGA